MNANSSPHFKTLDYYNENAKRYFDRTIKIDYRKSYDQFLSFIPPQGKILDAGCGSGRDTKAFLNKGFCVTSIDASKELVYLAQEYTGQDVLLMNFEDIHFYQEFDGIWSVASLLHIPSQDFLHVLKKIKTALKPEGVWYLSMRFGSFEGFVDDRYYHYMTEEKLSLYMAQLGDLKIIEMKTLQSYETESDLLWLHCLVQKSL